MYTPTKRFTDLLKNNKQPPFTGTYLYGYNPVIYLTTDNNVHYISDFLQKQTRLVFSA